MSKHEHNPKEAKQQTPEQAQEQQVNDSADASQNPENEEGQQPVSETEQLQQQLEEQKDKYIRLMAEFENYKRRTSKERVELIQTAGKDIIVSLLDVLDDCDRAEKQMQSETNADVVKEGAFLVFNKFKSIMQSKGVKALESVDKDFDVEHHEAIAEIPAPGPEKSGKIIDEVQKGYLLNDKLIRHAKVVVGK